MADDDPNQGRLTIFPAYTPDHVVANAPHRLQQYDPKEAGSIWKELRKSTPYPTIIPDPLEHVEEDDDALIQRISVEDCGIEDGLSIVTLTHHNWGRIDASLKEMGFMARAYEADVLIRRQPTGHIAILHDPALDLHFEILRDIFRGHEERFHRMRHEAPFDKYTWQYLKREGLLMNGDFVGSDSELRSRYEPTLLSLDWIRERLRLVLDRTKFYRSRAHECRQGNCTSRPNDLCPFRHYGLPQCMEVIRDRANARPRKGDAA